MKALSIRQPWAWLIVNGYKDVENREHNIGSHFGPLLIHASKTLTASDYNACKLFLRGDPALMHLEELLPDLADLPCGGIVGSVNVVGKIINGADFLDPTSSAAAWYTGAVGFYMTNAQPLPFRPWKGRLGFFNVDGLFADEGEQP